MRSVAVRLFLHFHCALYRGRPGGEACGRNTDADARPLLRSQCARRC